jgi:hypothetical protein
MRYRLVFAAVLALVALPAAAQGAVRPLPWFGLRIDGLVAASTGAPNTPTAAGVGAYALFDGREFLADVSADACGGDHAEFVAFGLGVYYPFALRPFAPYAGGGLKLGYTKFGGGGAFGLIPYLATGLLFGREGYVQVRAELAWFFDAMSENSSGPPNTSWHADGPMLSLGLAF